jgi:hypothetical protein
MKRKAVSWFFDCSRSPFTYGMSVWSGACEYQAREVHPPSPVNIRVELESVRSGIVEPTAIAELVMSSTDHLTLGTGTKDRIVLDSTPEMLALSQRLKPQLSQMTKIYLSERETTNDEQIMKYKMMLNSDRYFVDRSLLAVPDLIFDDYFGNNLIDPISTDEHLVFPITQSMLIACHYWDNVFKPSSFAYTSIAMWSR